MNRSNPAARSAPLSRSRSLLVLALAVTLLVAGLGGASNPVAAEDGETPTVTDQSAPIADETAVAPDPPLPESPTGIATEPSPPEGTETPTETATATVAPTEIPTITPTPVILSDELYCDAPMSAQGDQGWQFEFPCTYVVNSQRAQTRISATVVTASTGGWTAELRDPSTGGWSSAGTSSSVVDTVSVTPGTTIAVAVRLTSPAASQGGEQATVQLAGEIVALPGEEPATRPGPVATVAATVPQPAPTPTPPIRIARVIEQPNPGALACTEPNGDTVIAGEVIAYQCAVNVTYSNQGNTEAIFTGSITTGWSVSITGVFSGSTYSVPFGSPHVELKVPAKGALSGTLTISVRAPATAAPGATGTMSMTTSCTNAGACGAATQRPSATIVTTVMAGSCTGGVAAALTGVSLAPVAYSATPQRNNGTMLLTVQNPARCSGWSVTISGTDLRYSGAAPNQAPIPVGNVQVTIPGKPPVQLASQAKPLVTDGGTNTAYTYPLGIALDIPGGSAAGTYTATVTIATTSAPQ